jgi:hypothetical protein
MPQTSVLFVAVTPMESAVTFIWEMAHSAAFLFFRLLLIRSRPLWKDNAKRGTDLLHDVLMLTEHYHKFEWTPRCGLWIGRLQRTVSTKIWIIC